MTTNSQAKQESQAARRHIQKALKHLAKACLITGRTKIAVAYEVTPAAPRPVAPAANDSTMTPKEFRELSLSTFDSLLIAASFPTYRWEIPALPVEYATAGSGENEKFIAPPRSIKNSKNL